MKAVELMEILAMAVENNPKVDVSFTINKEDIKDFDIGTVGEFLRYRNRRPHSLQGCSLYIPQKRNKNIKFNVSFFG
jgi:hypothetical protein